ncbi:hypothetical protein [Microcoleus sp.]
MTKLVLVIQERRSHVKSGSIVGRKIESTVKSQPRSVQPDLI